MNTYILDCETDGLLQDLTTVHCMTLRRVEDLKVVHSFNTQGGSSSMEAGMILLEELIIDGCTFVGHNIIGFDNLALQKVYPEFKGIPEKQMFDTMIIGRLIYPDLWNEDRRLNIQRDYPKQLMNKHSLEAWGHRLQCFKGNYEGDTRIEDLKLRKKTKWDSWNPDMQEYCDQDTLVTEKLYLHLKSKEYSQVAIDLEHDVRNIITAQEIHGCRFDVPAALALVVKLTDRKIELTRQLQDVFKPKFFSVLFTPKGNNEPKGYTAGAPFNKVVLTPFSPSNRNHIARWLIDQYGWKPNKFTPDGRPQIDEGVLASISKRFKEVEILLECFIVDKRLAAISTGKEAWLKHERNGRLHGSVNTNGAVTGRATHSKPNLSQVPASYSPYGMECRSLFLPDEKWVMVGADQSGVEGRCLAHYMARWDEGDYAKVILEGDIHTANQQAAGLATRDQAKTFFYAFIYGAGDAKLAAIAGIKRGEGKLLRAKFLNGLPAMGYLIAAVAHAASTNGYLKGLDGRHVPVRNVYAALNTLLQSAGALLAKKAMVIMRESVKEANLTHMAKQVLWNHDELQWTCHPVCAEQIGKMLVYSFQEAGEYFNFRIPIDGEYKIGKSWGETH